MNALIGLAMMASQVATVVSFCGVQQAQPPTITTIATKTTAMRMAASASRPQFHGGFDIGTMDALEERGELEASLMEQAPVGILGEEKSNGGKMKKKKKQANKAKKQKAAAVARALRQEGVVKLDGILSASTAASLREQILERRDEAYAAVADAATRGDDDDEPWRKYFADVLLKGDLNQRCDLLLPLKGWPGIQQGLHEILVASNLLTNTLISTLGVEGGEDVTLYELSALISEPGSARQPVHPDNPYQEHPPLLTTFIALQDITAEMGPTTFIPKSNTAKVHARYDDVPRGRDGLLRESPSVVALLNAGDASLFDSRSLHCGGANSATDGDTRVLLYMSFRNPRATEPIGNVGSIMKDIPRMDLAELRSKLAAAVESDNDVDPFDDEMEKSLAIQELRLAAEKGDALAQLQMGTKSYLGGEGMEVNVAEAVRWFELAASQGLAQAQFNAGVCHSTGEGLPKRDAAKSGEYFRLAAEQNYPGAKEAYTEVLRELESIE